MRRIVGASVALVVVGLACGSSSSAPGGGASDAGADAGVGADAGAGGADGATSSDASSSADSAAADAGVDASALLAARPYTLHVPAGYDGTKPTPLVVMFHGYSATGAGEEAYFQLTQTSDANTFLYAYADGTVDQLGNRFWNATDACCDDFHTGVDDVAYFDAIVADIEAKYDVDAKRVYVVGHSNGGFMSHRLACDRAGTVAAIVSLAGAVWDDPSRCAPSEHVSIAEVHGDADAVILYTGGVLQSVAYPSAPTTVATWAQKNGCAGALAATGQTLDLDTGLPGSETDVRAYAGCPSGIDVELWTIKGGAHIPAFGHPAWGDAVWAFLSAHPKP